MSEAVKVKVNISFSFNIDPENFPKGWTLQQCIDTDVAQCREDPITFLEQAKDYQVEIKVME